MAQQATRFTEGSYNKMDLINRQAYGFRNFQNYRRLTPESVAFRTTTIVWLRFL